MARISHIICLNHKCKYAHIDNKTDNLSPTSMTIFNAVIPMMHFLPELIRKGQVGVQGRHLSEKQINHKTQLKCSM